MTINRVTTITLRPDKAQIFQEQVAELADAAVDKNEAWRWTAHEVLFGEGLRVHFASSAESFEQIEKEGRIDDLWTRVLGESGGTKAMRRADEAIASVEQTVSMSRPDLSYAGDVGSPDEYPYAVVTTALARPGQFEGCEELIRKVAEAIPKVGDEGRILTHQVMFGRMGAYWTIRPLARLADLDRQLPATELLNQAFGHAEGGLLWRSGSEAIEEAHREVIVYVPQLSNPPQA